MGFSGTQPRKDVASATTSTFFTSCLSFPETLNHDQTQNLTDFSRIKNVLYDNLSLQNSKYKRDYEREASRSSSYLRDRDSSPSGGAGSGNSSLNNGNALSDQVYYPQRETSSTQNIMAQPPDNLSGNNSYRFASPDLDSPPRENRYRDSDRCTSFVMRMRDKERDRDSYKKDKYIGKIQHTIYVFFSPS